VPAYLPAVPTKKSKQAPAPDLDALTEQFNEALTEHGFVKLSAIKPTQARDAVVSKLVARGFELTRTNLRVPLPEQLRGALAHGATIAISALPAHVLGASKPELKALVDQAVRDGVAHRILRGRVESVVGASTEVLSPEAARTLSRVLGELASALSKASKASGLKLLSADVREALEMAQKAVPKAASAKLASESAIARVLQVVDVMRDGKTGLSFVPQVVERLAESMDTQAATQALLDAAARDLLELRPEGGLARLSSAELALCPAGPQGTRLSWVRRLAGGTT